MTCRVGSSPPVRRRPKCCRLMKATRASCPGLMPSFTMKSPKRVIYLPRQVEFNVCRGKVQDDAAEEEASARGCRVRRCRARAAEGEGLDPGTTRRGGGRLRAP